MSTIEVSTETLVETADRLRSATVDARRLRSALHDADVSVTGSPELTAALSRHADTWGHTLGLLHERVRSVARALDASARVYDGVERAVTAASTS